MKFLLIDDHKLFLDGLAQVLHYHIQGLEVLKADSVEIALQLIAIHSDIDLALVDLAMPKSCGIDFIKKVIAQEALIPVAVLSASNDLKQITQVLNVGALGFIPKTYNSDALVNAINKILAGEIYLPESVQQDLAQPEQTHSSLDIAASYEITPRQLEVLTLLAQGLANGKVAKTLFISEHTVKSHIKQLYQKLQVENRINCINQAKTLGILASD